MLAAALHGAAGWAQARITIEGDIEQIRQVSAAHQDNRERLQTWRGTAHVDHRERGITASKANRQPETVKTGNVSFVQTRFKLRSHWTDEVVKYPDQGPDVKVDDRPRFYNQMKLDDGLYRYRGLSGSDDPSQLVIFPRNDPPSYEDLDAMALLQKDFQGQDYEALLNYICDEVSREAPTMTDDSQDMRIAIARNGDVVELRLAVDRTDRAPLRDTLQFDLSRGGNLIGREHGASKANVQIKFTYEERDGVWIPKHYEENRMKQANDPLSGTSVKTIAFATDAVNQPIPDGEFMLTTLGIKPGDLVTDRRQPDSAMSFKYSGNNGVPEAELGRFAAMLTDQNPASRPAAEASSVSVTPREQPSIFGGLAADNTETANTGAKHTISVARSMTFVLLVLAAVGGGFWLMRRKLNHREAQA